MSTESKAIETREPVVVKVSEFKGKDRLDIRHHYVKKDGEFGFTEKGVNMPFEYAEQFVVAVKMLFEEPEKPQLLDIGRGPDAPVVASFSEYKGVTRLDVRHYWTPEGKDQPCPTKKGVNIPLDLAGEFVDELQKVVAVAKSEVKLESEKTVTEDAMKVIKEYAVSRFSNVEI